MFNFSKIKKLIQYTNEVHEHYLLCLMYCDAGTEPLENMKLVRTMVSKIIIIAISASHEVQVLSRFLARDVQSNTGQNLQYIKNKTGLSPWTASRRGLRDALVAGEVAEVSPRMGGASPI